MVGLASFRPARLMERSIAIVDLIAHVHDIILGMQGTATDLQELVRRHRQEILEAAGRYGASNLRLFGSVARGDFREGSDIDILIELEKGRSLFDMVGLGLDLEKILGRKVDVFTEKSLKERIRARVLREAVPL
jgi:predicted nucleotidyltransferase